MGVRTLEVLTPLAPFPWRAKGKEFLKAKPPLHPSPPLPGGSGGGKKESAPLWPLSPAFGGKGLGDRGKPRVQNPFSPPRVRRRARREAFPVFARPARRSPSFSPFPGVWGKGLGDRGKPRVQNPFSPPRVRRESRRGRPFPSSQGGRRGVLPSPLSPAFGERGWGIGETPGSKDHFPRPVFGEGAGGGAPLLISLGRRHGRRRNRLALASHFIEKAQGVEPALGQVGDVRG